MSWANAFSKVVGGAVNSLAMGQMKAKYEAEIKKAKRSGAAMPEAGDGAEFCSPCAAQGYLDDMRKTLSGG